MDFDKSPTSDSPQSPSSVKKGRWGEQVAAEYLFTQGYAIVEHNWRCGHYEIDLVAQKGQRMVFVEVKTRHDPYVDPLLAVNASKRRRIIRSADAYMRMFDVPFDYQFDIVLIIGAPNDYTIEHIPDAYLPTVS